MRDIVRRARRKAGRLLREWVPYNGQYRPVGVHSSSRELAVRPGSGAAYAEVVPGYNSTLAIPPAFYALASKRTGLHGKPNSQEQVPPAGVCTLTRGRLYADNPNSVAVMAADAHLVGDVSFQYDGQQLTTLPPEQNNIFRQRYFLPPRQVPGTVCSLLAGGGAAIGNYYHWLIDSLPRLHLVQQAGLLDTVDFFLVYDKSKRFVQETLAALHIGPERIIDVLTHPHWQADTLIVTSPVRGRLTHTPPWVGQFLRRTLLPPPPVSRTFSPFIYISRRDAPGRQIINEEAVEHVLREYGFETHVLTPYSQAEKIALFAQARVIISSVGAGLANIVFTASGAQLIELFPRSFVVADYLEFTSRLGIGHHYLVCDTPNASAGHLQAQRDDLLVDLDQLRPVVEAALQQQQQQSVASVAVQPPPLSSAFCL